MAYLETKHGRMRETGHLMMRPLRDGRPQERGFYDHKGRFVALATPVQQDEHVLAYRIATARVVKLAPAEHRGERKRGGCAWTSAGSIWRP